MPLPDETNDSSDHSRWIQAKCYARGDASNSVDGPVAAGPSALLRRREASHADHRRRQASELREEVIGDASVGRHAGDHRWGDLLRAVRVWDQHCHPSGTRPPCSGRTRALASRQLRCATLGGNQVRLGLPPEAARTVGPPRNAAAPMDQFCETHHSARPLQSPEGTISRTVMGVQPSLQVVADFAAERGAIGRSRRSRASVRAAIPWGVVAPGSPRGHERCCGSGEAQRAR
jgi:hypothetical protein